MDRKSPDIISDCELLGHADQYANLSTDQLHRAVVQQYIAVHGTHPSFPGMERDRARLCAIMSSLSSYAQPRRRKTDNAPATHTHRPSIIRFMYSIFGR